MTTHLLRVGLLVVVITYPHSPVLFQLLLFEHQIAVALAAIAILVLSIVQTRPASSSDSIARILRWYTLTTCFVLLMSFLVVGTPSAIRELLFIAAVAGLTLLSPARMVVRTIEDLGGLFALMALISGIVAAAVFLGLIDLSAWNAFDLGLDESNPALARARGGDAGYYLPYRIASLRIPEVVTNQGFGLAFVRQTFVFSEPSLVWYYFAPMWLLAWANPVFRRRRFCLAVLGAALLFSFSIFGILALGATMLVVMIGRATSRRVTLIVVVLLVLAPIGLNLGGVLNSINPTKLDQIEYYRQNIEYGEVFGTTLLGIRGVDDQSVVTVGSLDVARRYGSAGMVVYLLWAVVVSVWSLKFLLHVPEVGRSMLYRLRFASILLTVLLAFRLPSMGVLMMLLVLAYWRAVENDRSRKRDHEPRRLRKRGVRSAIDTWRVTELSSDRRSTG